ncbi:Uncharacterised protein [Escherichia coli]|uniref:Uncharacterized protein n=1 Tax=Escherichia coli TaxID=562 RepID=A0A376LPR7_ECOLX|nr:Uncharacterised protein [Escherichia coli]
MQSLQMKLLLLIMWNRAESLLSLFLQPLMLRGAAIALAADGVKLFVAPSEQAAPDPIIAYCQEDVTLEAEDFIRVRVA